MHLGLTAPATCSGLERAARRASVSAVLITLVAAAAMAAPSGARAADDPLLDRGNLCGATQSSLQAPANDQRLAAHCLSGVARCRAGVPPLANFELIPDVVPQRGCGF